MVMKKLVNRPEDITRELFAGLVKSNPDLYEFAAPDIITRKVSKEKGKIWITSYICILRFTICREQGRSMLRLCCKERYKSE